MIFPYSLACANPLWSGKSRLLCVSIAMLALGALAGSVSAQQPAATDAQEPDITTLWSRTFAPASLDTAQRKPITGDASESPADDPAKPNPKDSGSAKKDTSLVDNINKFYGAPEGKEYITEQGKGFYYIKGPRAKVVAIKRDLLRIDAARPQVQLDMWTVQISGNPKSIAKNSAEIREKFDRANQAMQMVKSLRGDAAQNPQYLDYSDPLLSTDPNTGFLQKIGFNPDPLRPLSLTESLIFLGLQTAIVNPDGTLKKDGKGEPGYFQGKMVSWSNYSDQDKKSIARICTLKKLQQQVAALNSSALLMALGDQFKTDGKANPDKLLLNLLDAYSSNPASDRAGIFQFAEAAKDFDDPSRSLMQQEKDIARLRATAAASDRLIKAATDAFAFDMQEMFLKPIFDEVSQKAGSTTSGVALTGKARLVVTSRIQTGINPQMNSYVETTRPKPLDLKALMGQPASGSSNAATPSASGDARALSGLLSQPQLLLLGAALNPVEPEITQVAPGVAINVLPTVLPDGGSARLQLDFDFGVQSKVIASVEKENGRRASVPVDGIVSNHVKTDLTISAFELFDVSSFSVESSYPRSRYLPVIGSIPLLGEIIKKPPKNKVTRHESLVLVNAIILPRVLDLTHFYGD